MKFIPLYEVDRDGARLVIERLGQKAKSGKLTTDEAFELQRAIYVLDPKRFIEENIEIIDKQGRRVPFILNRAQKYLLDKLVRQIEKYGFGKGIVDKARQLGVSTLVEAIAVWFGLCHKNVKIAIVGNKSSNSEHIFGIASTAIKGLRPPWNPPGQGPLSKEARFEFVEEDGKEAHTIFKVDTAGDKDLLRGFTPAFLHASEYAFWPFAKIALTAVEQGIPHKGSIEIIESTGWPGTHFEKLWKLAVEGKSDFIPFFFPWYWGEDYCIPLSETGGKLYPVEVYGTTGELIPLAEWEAEEERLLSLYKTCPIDGGPGITIEHLNWRRWMVMNKFGAEIAMFNVEHPTVWQDSFNAPQATVFPKEVIAEMLDRARTVQPVARMTLHRSAEERIIGEYQRKLASEFDEYQPLPRYKELDESLVPFDDPDGAVRRIPITIWRQPEDGRTYLVTGDTADGANPSDGDYLTADVWQIPRAGEQILHCAQVRGRIHEDIFAEIMYQLSRYYLNAEIVPEANHIEIIRYLKAKPRANLHIRTRQDDSVVDQMEIKYGWWTSGKTRQIMIAEGKRLLRQRAVEINSLVTLEELRDFIPKNRKGNIRMEAAGKGHDDAVFSFMIMAAILADRRQRTERQQTEEELEIEDFADWERSLSNSEGGGNDWMNC